MSTRVLSRTHAHKRAEEGGRQEGVELTGWDGRWGGRLQKPSDEPFILEAGNDRARADQREEERGAAGTKEHNTTEAQRARRAVAAAGAAMMVCMPAYSMQTCYRAGLCHGDARKQAGRRDRGGKTSFAARRRS
jgi:hypothetical protein